VTTALAPPRTGRYGEGMPFERHPAVKGRVYVPPRSRRQKHPCRDCFACLFCSDERCAACLRDQKEGASCRRCPVVPQRLPDGDSPE